MELEDHSFLSEAFDGFGLRLEVQSVACSFFTLLGVNEGELKGCFEENLSFGKYFSKYDLCRLKKIRQ